MMLRSLKESKSLDDALGMAAYSALAAAVIETTRKAPEIARLSAELRALVIKGELDNLLPHAAGITITGELQKAVNDYLQQAFSEARGRKQRTE